MWFWIPLVLLLALTLDCWFSKKLLPLFGSRLLARLVWSLSFLLANLPLLLAYLLVPRLQLLRFERERLRDGVLLASVLVAAALQVPPGSYDGSRLVLAGDLPVDGWGFGLSTSDSTLGSRTSFLHHRDGSLVLAGDVRVTHSPDVLSRALGLALAEELATQPWTDDVELLERGTPAPAGLPRAPVLYVDVDAGSVEHRRLPASTSFQGGVRVTLNVLPAGTEGTGPDHRVDLSVLSFEGTYDLSVTTVGLLLGDRRLAAVVEPVVGDVAEAIADWTERQAHHGTRTPPRGSLAPAAEGAEPFPGLVAWLDGRGAVLAERSHAPYVHRRRVWIFEDERGARAALSDLQAALDEAGWERTWLSERDQEFDQLGARDANRGGSRAVLAAGRWPEPIWRMGSFALTLVDGEPELETVEPTPPEGPFTYAVRLEERFTDDELTDRANELAEELERELAADEDLEPALGDLWNLRRALDGRHDDLLLRALTRSAGAHIARWEYLVELQLEADEHEAAVETFAVAHTLASVGWHQDAKQRLDKLAEEHDLPDPRPGSHEAALELLRRTGIRELTDEPLTLELGLGEVATLLVPYGGNGPTLWSIRPTELGQEPRFATRECSSGLKSEGDHGMVVGLTSSLGLGNIRARVEDLGGRLRLTLNPDD